MAPSPPSRTSIHDDKPVPVATVTTPRRTSTGPAPLSGRKSLNYSFSEKLDDYLNSTESDCDVVFAVGPDGEKVRAVRLVLVVASPVFKNLFESEWDNMYHTYTDEGIPLPDLDPEAFRLFLRLLLWNDVSPEKIGELELSAKNLFSLVELSKTYGLPEMQASLEILAEKFFKTIHKYVTTEEFLTLPMNILGSILKQDSLPMDEVAVFDCAYKWAEYQCLAHGFVQNGINIRGMLDNHLFAIRFPVMSIKDFGNKVCPVNILTAEEELKIFKYISMAESEKQSFDASTIPFCVERRKRCDPVPSKLSVNKVNNASTTPTAGSKTIITRRGSERQLTSSSPVVASPSQPVCRGPKRTATKSSTSVSSVTEQPEDQVGQRLTRGRNLKRAVYVEQVSESDDDEDHTYSQSSVPSTRSGSRSTALAMEEPIPGPKPPKVAKLSSTAAPSSSSTFKTPKGSAASLRKQVTSQQRLVRDSPVASQTRFPRKKTDEIPISDSLVDGAFVNVCYKWDCGKLTICADEDGPKYDILEELLTQYAKNAPSMHRLPEMNEVVIAPDSRGHYYRGVVTGLRGADGVKVEFIDYGGQALVQHYNKLKELNEEINNFPVYGIKFRLMDVPENAFHTDVSNNAELEAAMKSGGTVEILKKAPGLWTGKLWISETRAWSDIISDAVKSQRTFAAKGTNNKLRPC